MNNYKKSSEINIKLFEGLINHNRTGKINHFFKNKINAILLDLKKDNNDNFKKPSFFSTDKFNFFGWSASDHGPRKKGTNKDDLYEYILSLITNSSYDKNKIKDIKLLTFPKVFGYGFNPLSVYFCYNSTNLLVHTVFEVKNTFGDIHHYVLKNTDKKVITQRVLKKLFVSPFYNKNGYYNLYAKHIDKKIITSVEYVMNNNTVFFASMNLKEIQFNNLNILKSICKLIVFPGKIWINIHLQAFLLWLKKARIYKVPKSETIKHSFGNHLPEDK